jgi:transposase
MTTAAAVETIGVDLGDKQAELCVLKTDGGIERPKPVRMNRASFKEYFTRPKAHVVIEVSTHSRWVSRLLEELGHRVTVANPRRLRLISESDSKTDRTDAELLARLGRSDLELLSPVKHRGEQAQLDLAVAKSRDTLVACRTKLINHTRSLVKSFGERLPSGYADGFHIKCEPLVPETLKPALEPIFRALEAMAEEIKQHDKTLREMAKRYPDAAVLGQPNGVGLLTALVFLLTIEDKKRFEKSRTVGSFVGLRPKKDQSGDSDKQLHITKAGDHLLRKLLVQSANYILGPFGKDSDLRQWGLELARRGGQNGRKRAKVAVARKLAVLMHRLWVTGEVYEPIGYGKKAA